MYIEKQTHFPLRLLSEHSGVLREATDSSYYYYICGICGGRDLSFSVAVSRMAMAVLLLLPSSDGDGQTMRIQTHINHAKM